jgi:hypothetical protein
LFFTANKTLPHLLFLIFLTSGILFLVFGLRPLAGRMKLSGLFYISRALIVSGIFCFIAFEASWIFNQRGLNAHPLLIYGVCVILALIVYISLRKRLKKHFFHTRDTISGKIYLWIPVLIAVFAYYQPVIPFNTEMFENANPANAILRSAVFGEWPFWDYMSSHMLSETVFGFIYVFFNGFDGGQSFYIYDFLHKVFFLIIIYIFIWKISGRHGFALLFTLFFPFTDIAFCEFFSYSIISLFFLDRIYHKPDFKIFLFSFAWVFFLILWRIDVGHAALWPFFLLFVMLLLYHRQWKIVKRAGIALIVVIIAGIAIALLGCLIRQVHFLTVFWQVLHYVASDQANGNVYIAPQYDRLFLIHYVIFPVTILVIGLLIMTRFRQLLQKHGFLVPALIFLIVFYFANIPRGLVRHGFNENTDLFITSFSFLILSLSVLLLFRRKNLTAFSVFSFTLLFMIILLKYPDTKDYQNVTDAFGNHYNTLKLPAGPDKIQRCPEPEYFAEQHYSDIKNLMDQHFDRDATFIDFSNTPMLYFYTQRRVPSYFNQYIQNIFDSYLEKENLKLLDSYDIPVVLFSNIPLSWGDMIDGIPGAVRQQLIAGHIFRNYRPYAIINHHAVWLRKDIPAPSTNFPPDSISGEAVTYSLKKLPLVLASQSKNPDVVYTWNETIFSLNENDVKLELPEKIDKSTRNALLMHVKKQENEFQCGLSLMRDSIPLGKMYFTIIKSNTENHYLLPLSSLYNWYAGNPTCIRIYCDQPAFTSVSLIKTSD